ncbi:GTP-binding protein [Marinicella gelatinilytica]|uniref:GTP-binding protein n=1 Tax=Marinicella gelatinilytica TaxID=2996017 RepID=UPI002260CF2F|nr:ATP/GTP-binding protein [Marinicella gelatinilytica]MCX7546124.1 ATP/GTP-binding protein [Marinicella gelatinilytica]
MKNSYQKIVIAGPVGSGKTTAVNTMSDIPVVGTEVKASDETKLLKENTTVAMDYGTVALGGKQKLHIYGTPGQKRFDFMWDMLGENCIGVVLLVDASAKDFKEQLAFFLGKFSDLIAKSSLAVGVTKTDEPGAAQFREVREAISEEFKRYPVFEVDARHKPDLMLLVEALLFVIDPKIQVDVSG